MQKAIGMIEFKPCPRDYRCGSDGQDFRTWRSWRPRQLPRKICGNYRRRSERGRAAVERARATRPEELIDDFMLGNLTPPFPGHLRNQPGGGCERPGILETYERPPLLWRRISR